MPTPSTFSDAYPFDQTWQQIKHFAEQERHFNTLQSEYRRMASGWLMAVFAGIGFMLKSEFQAEGLSGYRPLFVAFIALAGIVGIFLLWMLDLLIYHRLLKAYTLAQEELERRHPDLPQVSLKIYNLLEYHGTLSRVQLFYIIPCVGLLLVSAAAMWLYLRPFGLAYWLSSTICYVLAGVLLVWYMRRETSYEHYPPHLRTMNLVPEQ